MLRESEPLTEIESEPNDSVLMLGHDAGKKADEADEVAVDRRKIDELAARDVAADFLGRHVDERRLGRDGHDLLDAADGELQIERRRLADLEANVLAARAS